MHVDVGELNRGVSWVQFCCSIHDYKGLIAVILNLSNFSRGESCHSLRGPWFTLEGSCQFLVYRDFDELPCDIPHTMYGKASLPQICQRDCGRLNFIINHMVRIQHLSQEDFLVGYQPWRKHRLRRRTFIQMGGLARHVSLTGQ